MPCSPPAPVTKATFPPSVCIPPSIHFQELFSEARRTRHGLNPVAGLLKDLVRPRVSTKASCPLLLDWRVASTVGGRARAPESPGGLRKGPHIQKTVSPPNQTSRPDDSGLVAGSHSCAPLLISVPRWCLPPTDCPAAILPGRFPAGERKRPSGSPPY